MTFQELNDKYQAFKNKYNGKYTDYDGAYGAQCWDLAQRYFVEYLGVPEYVLSGSGLVSNMLNEPKRSQLLEYFDEIPVNSMCPGDTVIWEYGHIALFDRYDGANWYFSQNPNPCQVMNLRQDGQHAFRLKGVYQPEPPKVEEPKQEVIVDNTKVKELEEQIKLKDEEIKVLQERVLELTEQRDIVLKNQPTLIYTAPKDIIGRIKLKKDEKLFIK